MGPWARTPDGRSAGRAGACRPGPGARGPYYDLFM